MGSRPDTFPLLVWSGDSRRLSYQRRHYGPRAEGQTQVAESEHNWRQSFESVRAETGERIALQSDVRIGRACITTSRRILFLRSDNSEYPFVFSIWEVQTDAKTGALGASPRRLANQKEVYMTGLSCSADGKVAGVLAQVSVSNIYIAEIQQPRPRLRMGGLIAPLPDTSLEAQRVWALSIMSTLSGK